jgi:hypothetical protein
MFFGDLTNLYYGIIHNSPTVDNFFNKVFAKGYKGCYFLYIAMII